MLRVRYIIKYKILNINYYLFLYDLHFALHLIINIVCTITHLIRNHHPYHSVEEIKA